MAGTRRSHPTGVTGDAAPASLGRVLEEWIDRSGLRPRLELAEIVESWPEVVGPQIAAVTRALGVTDDATLLVRVSSPAWATELGMMTPRILGRLNGSRKGRANRIRWIVGPLDRA